ncbi:MAG: class I SAM-dependent methyltransferase [Actinomycetales bacterium]
MPRPADVSGWGGVAEAYRRSFGSLCEGTVDRLVADTPGARHLDVGCGTGVLAARAVAAGRNVVAVDSAADMVDASRRHLAGVPDSVLPSDLPWALPAVLHAALPRLPFAHDAFDGVTANFVVNHVSDPGLSLRELRRVTRPGGRVAATVWPAGGTAWADAVSEAFERAGALPVPARRLSPDLDFERSPEGLAQLAGAAGLRVLEATEVVWAWQVVARDLWSGIAAGIATAGARYVAQHVDVQVAADEAYYAIVGGPDAVLSLPSRAVYVLATVDASADRSFSSTRER